MQWFRSPVFLKGAPGGDSNTLPDKVFNVIQFFLPHVFRGAIVLACIGLFALQAVYPSLALGQTKRAALEGLGTAGFVATLQGTWQIDAARIEYDRESGEYVADGNVQITSTNRSLQADWASLNTNTRQVELKGHVRLRYGANWVEGAHVLWDIDRETGWIDQGTVYFGQNHLFVQGKSIRKTGPLEYELKDGSITGCDPASPDWKVRCGEMKIDLDGVAWAKNTSFWVRDLPVFYAPIVTMPVQLERQSGFLTPWAGSSSNNGYQFEIPYYWAIRKDMDMTFYARYMTERGFMGGVEYRINNETLGKGAWLFNYMDDQASRQHLQDIGFPFQTEDRYWVRGKQAIDRPEGIEIRLDLDYVSDVNYLQEFSNGSTSYGYSNKLFRSLLGTGILLDNTLPYRESAFYADKHGDDTILSLDTRYWENLNTAQKEYTVQRLPAVNFDVVPTSLGRTPLYYSMDSSLVNYWRQEGDKGDRLDLMPRLYYPLHWGNYLNLEPVVGMRGTSYVVDWQGDNHDQLQGRYYTDVRVDLNSRLNKVYSVDFAGFNAIQHSIRPEILYEYVQNPIEGILPHFDRWDENQSRHDIRFGFSNIFTAREVVKDSEGNPVTRYNEFAKIDLYQIYNIEKMPEVYQSIYDIRRDEGLSALALRVDIMPSKYVTLSYDSDLYNTGSTAARHDLLLRLDDLKGHILQVDYAYQKDLPANELTTELLIKTFANVYLDTYHDYSFDQNEMYRQGYGLKFIHGCWSIGLGYERELGDDRVIFTVGLLGLGSVGGKSSFEATGMAMDSLAGPPGD